MPLVQFAPFASLVQPSFWHKLTELKIDVLRLSDAAVPVTATYTVGRAVRDRESGKDVALGCHLSVGGEAFDNVSSKDVDTGKSHSFGHVVVDGILKNYNTIEEFKAADKASLFNAEASQIWDHIIATRDSKLLNRFLVITFADLKKYRYYYWFSFPAFVAKPAWEISATGWSNAVGEFSPEALTEIFNKLKSSAQSLPFFLVRSDEMGKNVDILPIEHFSPPKQNQKQAIAFIDPSADPATPGWPLRNLLTFLHVLYPEHTTTIRVLCWRDLDVPHIQSSWKSIFGVLNVDQGDLPATMTQPSAVGWEKNPQGKLGPRLADLAPMMDPTRLAEQAVDLNLKLMRWRILPALNLEKMSETRCLLLGAGTLGCYVARTLMGWGVRTITFVDSARVSFSNPVRQPLFEFEDCLEGGKPKAECAAARLKKIYPGINSAGHTLSIPMPGHPIPNNPTSLAQARSDVKKLEGLVDSHDAVFLLMDSRESRWLPTVLGAAKGKIVMNAALGFDTFLVMRHGPRASTSSKKERLGCYYCNDIVAPTDSLTDRTLDQMCTVTRPGLASIAASTAVELLASLIQHPEGLYAPAPPPNQELNNTLSYSEDGGSVLGQVPHQLRGFLAQFRNIPLIGAAYDKCTGCSETVITAYEQDGFDMLLQAFNDQKYLEKLTGLDKLFDESEAALESVDWDEEGDEF